MPPPCFVLMPFGKKTIPSGMTVDFDAVYRDLIAPAIAAANMEALRAVADLTGANANVFYELGLHHGVRPATTVLCCAPDRCRSTWRCCARCPTAELGAGNNRPRPGPDPQGTRGARRRPHLGDGDRGSTRQTRSRRKLIPAGTSGGWLARRPTPVASPISKNLARRLRRRQCQTSLRR